MSIGSAPEFLCRSPQETEALAEHLGRLCRGGELLLLVGELGAGKTVFVRGLARGLGCDPGLVRSPSYTLLLRYPGPRRLNHFDVYFTDAVEDLERSELHEELAAGAVVVLEWGDRFEEQLPPDRLRVELVVEEPEVRRVRLCARGLRSQALLDGLPRGEPEHAGQ